MHRSLLVALLQVRIYLQDKGDLAFSLLLPIAIFALMYGAFGGQTQFHGTAHVVNEDQGGAYSALLIQRLEGVDNLDVELLSASKADVKLDRADLLMVLYIPDGFSDRLASGQQAQLLFKQRGNGGDEGQIVASIVGSVAEQMAQEYQVRNQVGEYLAGSGIGPEQIDVTVQRFLEDERESPAVSVREETVGASPNMVETFLPGIVTMFVLFAVTMTARALVEERKKGTLERLLTTRLSVGQLFMGKFTANLSRGCMQTLILLLLSYAVFQMFTPLSFVESLVIAVIFIAAVSALGLIIGSVARTEDQATWVAVFFTMVMVMLGGTFFEMPESGVLSVLSKISINTYANDALKTVIADGGSLADVGLKLAVLAGVAVIGMIIARVLFKVMPGGR
jgi:ABC-2 type transport system permease protein